MCRLMAYIGQPALLADLMLWPDRSIIKQSYDARERRRDPTLPNHVGFGNLNADGFGIGWFNPDDRREEDPSPCVFTSITPAWNNENLSRLACKVTSPLVFAHVRAAYPGMPVSEQNCHPFNFGRYLWMHNGVVGGFAKIKRSLLAELSETAYNSIQSFHSDSSVSFAVFLNHLPDIHTQQPPDVLMRAMQDALATISKVQTELCITQTSVLNFVVSDGSTLIATRYVWPETEPAATLYYAEGASFVREDQDAATLSCAATLDNSTQLRGSSILQEASYALTYGVRGSSVAFVASEPITGSSTDWVAVPKNTGLIITREKAGYLNIMHTPLRPREQGDCDQACEVYRCLEAIGHGLHVHVPVRDITQPSCAQVYRCLEAIGRGLHEKSRTWLPRQNSLGTSHAHQLMPSACGPARRDSDSSPTATAATGLSRENSVSWWDSGRLPDQMDQEQHRLGGHDAAVLCLLMDQEGRRLFTGGADALIKIWSLETWQCLHTILGVRKPIQQLYVRANKLYTVSGRKLRVWDLVSYRCVYSVKTTLESGSVRSMWVSPFLTVYVGTQDTLVRAFRIDERKFSHRYESLGEWDEDVSEPDAVTDPVHGHAACVNALTGVGRHVCSAGGDGTVRLWDAETLDFVNVLRGHRGSVLCLMALGNLLLSGARDNTIRVWDMEANGMCRKTLQGHKDDVVQLSAIRVRRKSAASGLAWNGDAMSPARFSQQLAGMLVASASADGTIRVWSTNWTCIRIFSTAEPSSPSRVPPSIPAVLTVAISQSQVIGGYSDGTIRVWRSDDLYAGTASKGEDSIHGGDRTLQHLLDGLEEEEEGEEGDAMALSRHTDSTSTSSHEDFMFGIEGMGSSTPRVPSSSSMRTDATENSEDSQALPAGLDAPSQGVAGTCPQLGGGCMKHDHHVHSSSLNCLSQLARHAALVNRSRSCPRFSPRANGCPPQVLLPSQQAIEAEMEACLREFVRIKTVSLDSKHRQDCFLGAKYLARLLESLGADIKLVPSSEERNPLVLGRLGSAPDRPTVTFYGHYDVQPATEPDWQTKPFELRAQDGYFMGRGVSDNKGPILAFIFAVKELMDRLTVAGGDSPSTLPVNIAFIFEGEEENGSLGFAEALQQNLHWFSGTQLVVISNTQWVGENVPCLTYGMRGTIALSVEVSGPSRDLHSGNEGGAFNEPLMDLSKLLGTLVDSNARIRVPGFYDDIAPTLMDHTWESLQDSEEFTLEGYQAALGLPALSCPGSKRELLRARWCLPSLSLVDLRPSYVTGGGAEQRYHRFGPTRFSVIPKSAVGKICIRYVAHQDPKLLVQRIRDFLDAEFKLLGSSNRLAVHVESIGSSWEGDPEAMHFKVAEQAIQREWGMKPLYVREGGTMPVASHIEKALGAPAILIPLGQASDNCHLANERMRRINLLKGKNVIRNLLEEVGRLGIHGLAQRSASPAQQAALEAQQCGSLQLGSQQAACGPQHDRSQRTVQRREDVVQHAAARRALQPVKHNTSNVAMQMANGAQPPECHAQRTGHQAVAGDGGSKTREGRKAVRQAGGNAAAQQLAATECAPASDPAPGAAGCTATMGPSAFMLWASACPAASWRSENPGDLHLPPTSPPTTVDDA